MSKILVSLGYHAKVILPDDADSGIVIAAIARATMVESHGYGADAKYTPTNSSFSVERLSDSQVVVDEADKQRIEIAELTERLARTNRALAEKQAEVTALKSATA